MKQIDNLFFDLLLDRNTILTLNRDEIILLCGTCDSIIQQVQHYLLKHAITIIARLDSDGAWICRPYQEPIYFPAHKVDVIDTIGAGDYHLKSQLN